MGFGVTHRVVVAIFNSHVCCAGRADLIAALGPSEAVVIDDMKRWVDAGFKTAMQFEFHTLDSKPQSSLNVTPHNASGGSRWCSRRYRHLCSITRTRSWSIEGGGGWGRGSGRMRARAHTHLRTHTNTVLHSHTLTRAHTPTHAFTHVRARRCSIEGEGGRAGRAHACVF